MDARSAYLSGYLGDNEPRWANHYCCNPVGSCRLVYYWEEEVFRSYVYLYYRDGATGRKEEGLTPRIDAQRAVINENIILAK